MIFRRMTTVLFLAAGMVALWGMATVSTAAPDALDVNTFTLDLLYPDGGTEVQAGEIFTQRVRLERTEVTNQIFVVMEVTAPQESIVSRPRIDKSDSTRIENARYRDGTLQLQVAMNGNGFIQVTWPLEASCSQSEGSTSCEQGAVGAKLSNGNGDLLDELSAAVSVVPNSFDPTLVTIEAGALPESEGLPLETDINCVPLCKPFLIIVTNNNSVAARVPVRITLDNGIKWLNSGRDDNSGARQAGQNGRTRQFELIVPPGGTTSESIFVHISALSLYGTTYGGDIVACAEPIGSFDCPNSAGAITVDPLAFIASGRDLGDAPDSSNHADIVMPTGYGADGNFPTTVDEALDGPHGPAHARPWALHLGRGFSTEYWADSGPDMDRVNNLDPANAATGPSRLGADDDRFDDGIPLGQLSFADCETTMIPVRVAVQARTLQYFVDNPGTAYLNLWLDSNRDGDWADAGGCGGEAAEHIVVDYPVDLLDLGAGIHTVMVPTGQLSWPSANEGSPAWLRVTLAETKAPKLDGVPYGDGRGDGNYLMGETEDYFYYPPDAEGNDGDLEIIMEEVVRGDERRFDLAPDLRELDQFRPEINRELIIRFRNKGSKPLNDLNIELLVGDLSEIGYVNYNGWLTCVVRTADSGVIETIPVGPLEPEAETAAETLFVSTAETVAAPNAATQEPVQLQLLSSLAPESWGMIVVGLTRAITEPVTQPAETLQHTVIASTAQKRFESYTDVLENTDRPLRSPFIRLGWTGCLTCTRSLEEGGGPSEILSEDEAIRSLNAPQLCGILEACPLWILINGESGTNYKILRNGEETGETGTIGADGETLVEVVPQSADAKEVYQVVAVNGPLESEPSNRLDLSCPASGVQILTIEDGEGRRMALQPQSIKSGRDGIRVLVGDEVQVELADLGLDKNYFVYRVCRDQETEVSFNLGGQSIDLNLEKRLGNIFVMSWTGCLTCTRSLEQAQQATIGVEVTDPETTEIFGMETGFGGVAVDYGRIWAPDRDKFENPEIMILRRFQDGNGRRSWREIGDCVTTFRDGTWAAEVPAGEYMVIVKADGYQPYRSESVLFFDEADALYDKSAPRFHLSFDIQLTPNATTLSDIVDVEEGSAGFSRVLRATAGEAVLFNNFGASDIRVVFEPNDEPRQSGNSGFDSGLLAPSESFEALFAEPGSYTFRVAGDERQAGTIVVEAASSTGGIFLPLIMR